MSELPSRFSKVEKLNRFQTQANDVYNEVSKKQNSWDICLVLYIKHQRISQNSLSGWYNIQYFWIIRGPKKKKKVGISHHLLFLPINFNAVCWENLRSYKWPRDNLTHRDQGFNQASHNTSIWHDNLNSWINIYMTCLISGGAGISGAKSSLSSGSFPTASSSSVKISSCSQSSPKDNERD